ncbi:MAG: hypothetical protein JWN85_1521 [Gammaproteobacteria bacterium]|nr:hypothetical protein [Gammaproteobacteria bacterium]
MVRAFALTPCQICRQRLEIRIADFGLAEEGLIAGHLSDLDLDCAMISRRSRFAGFSDPAHFSRGIRAALGMSPREYRMALLRRRFTGPAREVNLVALISVKPLS